MWRPLLLGENGLQIGVVEVDIGLSFFKGKLRKPLQRRTEEAKLKLRLPRLGLGVS